MFQDLPECSRTPWNTLESSRDSWYQSQSLRKTISSASESSTGNQQGGKKGKGKGKNKNAMGLVEELLVEINSTMSALTGRVDDMDKRLEELESKGDIEKLRREMQATINSVVD